MIQATVLFTGATEYPYLCESLLNHNPVLEIFHAETVQDLQNIPDHVLSAGGSARLITFCTNEIIPESAVEAFPLIGYNFHPGPPEYPGSCSANFALYERAETFGVTAHELTAAVDAGPIVAVRTFPVPPDARACDLQAYAYSALIRMFHDLAPVLATSESRLPHTGDEWSPPARTRAEAIRLGNGEGPDDLDRQELAHRRRAFEDVLRQS